MLEGEVILTSMSYTLLKLHKRTVIKKGMEDLIEFLQVDLEKDFGYHDDEAITALQQSIAELRKHKMDLPTDAPSDLERPTKPFGYLLQADNASLSAGYDDQSVVGSIILKQGDSGSIGGNSSRASSMDYDQESGGKEVVRKEKEISGKEKEISGKDEEDEASSNPSTVVGENDQVEQGQTVTNVEVNGCSQATAFGTGNGQVRSGGRSESPERFCVREVSLPRLNAVEAIVSLSSIVYAPNDSTQVVTVTSPTSPPLSLHSKSPPVSVNHNSGSPASNNAESNSNRYIISNSNNEKVRIYVPFSCVEAVVSSERHLSSSNASILSASTTNSNSSSSFCNHLKESENSNHITTVTSSSGLPPVDTWRLNMQLNQIIFC